MFQNGHFAACNSEGRMSADGRERPHGAPGSGHSIAQLSDNACPMESKAIQPIVAVAAAFPERELLPAQMCCRVVLPKKSISG